MKWSGGMVRAAMKYLLPFFLLLTAYGSSFPTNAPSVGYDFVEAFHGLNTKALLPQLLTTRGSQILWTTRQQQVVTVNAGSITRTVAHDGSANSWGWGDSGMPGLVFHPANPLRAFGFYCDVERITTNGVVITNFWDTLAEYSVDPANTNHLTRSRVLIRQLDRADTHLGGAMVFGNDNYLYVTLADEGGQGDPYHNSQRIDGNFFGAVMRLDVDGRPGNTPPNPHPSIVGQYWVPNDNPYIGLTTFNGSPVDPLKVRTEFFMVGLRNPNTMHIDRPTGRIFVGDVGGAWWESVQEIVRGANAGWAATEGQWLTTFPTGSATVQRPPAGYRAPLWTYPHPSAVPDWDKEFAGNCVFVGPVLRGSRYPDLDGCLVVSDVSGPVWSLNITTKVVTRIGFSPGVTSWSIDPTTGDLLAGSYYGGAIRRMVRSVPSALPQTLSATGLFSDLSTLTPAAAVEYEVAAPFYSDDAHKRRWALPSGTIQRLGEKWESPAGSIWIKHFEAAGVRVETRVTVKTVDAAYGLSYRWRPDGSDADLVSSAGADFLLPNGQSWRIPSWSECLQCHNPLYGYTPGFRTTQINVNSQLEAMSAAGWFTEPVTNASSLPRLWPYDAPVPVANRFQSYLDANCSYCHQPGGQGRGPWDARASTSLDLAGIIDGHVEDTIGLPESLARVIAPGSLSNSVLYHRVGYHDANGLPAFHMPPMSTARINTNGVNLIAEFVYSRSPRTNWSLGVVGPASAPWAEFAQEDGRNTAPPGSSSVLDDDFYTSGFYPVGFNGLTSPLIVEDDELWTRWERALTLRDATNRIHFVTSSGPATLTLGLNRGAAITNGVVLGNPIHSIVVTHRADDGTARIISTFQIAGSPTVSIAFQATDGPQTIELVRTGPGYPFYSSAWINFDYVRIQRANQ